MSQYIEFVPNAAGLDFFLSNSGINSNVDKSVLQAAIEDQIRKLRCTNLAMHKVALLDVEDYSVKLPNGFISINHVAYRPGRLEHSPRPRHRLASMVTPILGSDCDLEMLVKCPKCKSVEDPCGCEHTEIVIEVDEGLKRQLPSLYKEAHSRFAVGHASWLDMPHYSPYHNEFRLIRPAQHSAFNADYFVRGCLNLNKQLVADSPYEFKIEAPYLKVNARDGQILFSYQGRPVSEDGFSLIPNMPEVFEMLEFYLTYRHLWREGLRTKDRNTRQESLGYLQMADRKLAIARELIETPTFNEWWTFLENNFTKMLPYYEFYQNWNRREPDHARIYANKLRQY